MSCCARRTDTVHQRSLDGFRQPPPYTAAGETVIAPVRLVLLMAVAGVAATGPMPAAQASRTFTLDSPASVVFDQAENRLHTQKALLSLLMG